MLKLRLRCPRLPVARRIHSTALKEKKRPAKHARFTAQEDDFIRAKRLEGETFRSIAGSLQRVQSSVHARWQLQIAPREDHLPEHLVTRQVNAVELAEVLKALQAGHGTRDIAKLLGVSVWKAVHYAKLAREGRFDPTPRQRFRFRALWQGQEDEQLVRKFNKGVHPRNIASQLGRTEIAIRSRITALFLVNNPPMPRKRWQAEDDDLLQSLATKNLAWAEIGRHFPDRTILGLRERWRKLNLANHPISTFKYWAAEDDSRLKELRDKGLRWAEIAEVVGRSAASCRNRFYQRHDRGRDYRNHKARWSPEEVVRLQQLVEKLGPNFSLIAAQLGRRRRAVYNMHRSLKLGQANVELAEAVAGPPNTVQPT